MSADHNEWGDRLRTWRMETMSWSQQELVDRVVQLAFQQNEGRGTNLNTRLVNRWENGSVQNPQPVYRRLLSELGAPTPSPRRATTGRAKAPDAHLPQDESDDVWSAQGSPSTPEDGTDDVLRREFLKLSSGVGLSSLLPSVDDAIGRQGQVGPDVLDVLRARLERLRRLDDHLGGADTFHLYAADAGISARILQHSTYPRDLHGQLLALLSEQCQQAGWAAFDAGWLDESERYFRHSHDVALEAGLLGLAANALAFRAYQQLSQDRSAVGTTDASLALGSDPAVHPGLRALLYDRGAWTYAISGKVEETDRTLHLAAESLAEARESALPTPSLASWVDETELLIMTGRCWSVLRKPVRAVPALETALAQYGDDHPRDKALYLSWLADAYIDANEPERAVATLQNASSLATGVASVRPQQRLQQVVDRLGPLAGSAGLTDLVRGDTLHPLDIRG